MSLSTTSCLWSVMDPTEPGAENVEASNKSQCLSQMMNCCIERKRARDEARKASDGSKDRDAAASPKPSSDSATKKSWESWSDSEEEFFECMTDQGEMDDLSTGEEKAGRKSKAEGRLHRHYDMTLRNSEEPLYVPVTQVRTSSSSQSDTQTTHCCGEQTDATNFTKASAKDATVAT